MSERNGEFPRSFFGNSDKKEGDGMTLILSMRKSGHTVAENRRRRYERIKKNREFYECIQDIVDHPAVLQMKAFDQHCGTDCYQHCLNVAYNNYCICLRLGLDARSAARGGMLHDLFLYDWRKHSKKTGDRLHAITHPFAAYRNARKYFHLNPVEKEVITKHMWPLSVIPPKYPETYVICLTDKYCGSVEIADYYAGIWEHRLLSRPLAWMMKKAVKKIPHVSAIHEMVPDLDSMERAAIPESFAQMRRRSRSGWTQKSGRRRRFS